MIKDILLYCSRRATFTKHLDLIMVPRLDTMIHYVFNAAIFDECREATMLEE
jgi:hypothetical protein